MWDLAVVAVSSVCGTLAWLQRVVLAVAMVGGGVRLGLGCGR
jgi:hypothetical protein